MPKESSPAVCGRSAALVARLIWATWRARGLVHVVDAGYCATAMGANVSVMSADQARDCQVAAPMVPICTSAEECRDALWSVHYVLPANGASVAQFRPSCMPYWGSLDYVGSLSRFASRHPARAPNRPAAVAASTVLGAFPDAVMPGRGTPL